MPKISSTSMGARPSEGSSSSTTLGWLISARRSPASAARRPTGSPIPGVALLESREIGIDEVDALLHHAGRLDVAAGDQVLLGGQVLEHPPSSNTWTRPSRVTSCARMPSMRRSRSCTVPLVTSPRSERSTPEMALSVVVLPAPLAPSRVGSGRRRRRSTRLSARGSRGRRRLRCC